MDAPRMLEVSRQLSAALQPADLDATLGNITAAAVEVLPEVTYASITVKHGDGRLETFAPTDDVVLEVDGIQYQLQEGPCYEAAAETVHVTAPRLADDDRFPRYSKAATERGIQAQVGIRLFETKGSNGALNLYSDQPGSFEDFDTISALFAHQSAMALGYARKISQLKEAVESRQKVGNGVGIVMERFGLDEARAFAFLTRMSMHSNVKIREIAQRLVDETNNTSSA